MSIMTAETPENKVVTPETISADSQPGKKNALPEPPLSCAQPYGPPPIENESNCKCQANEWREWGKFAVEVLTLLAVAYYACVASRQLTEMRNATGAAIKSADTASDTLHIAYRPRIAILGITPQGLENNRLHVTFTAPNFGPVPAKNVKVFLYDNVSTQNQAVRLAYSSELPDEPKVILPRGESGDGYGVNGRQVISQTELDGLKTGTLFATFSILIEYQDDFSIVHRAETCALFTLKSYSTVCPWPVQND
jgi:hypothetical protein